MPLKVNRTGDLAAVLQALIRRQRLTYAQIARPGRLSRNTVRLIALGQTKDPSEYTLAKIAIGLAVDPYTQEIDQKVLTMTLEKLGRASGHPDLGQRWAENVIPVLLATLTGNVESAVAWVELIARFPNLDAQDISRVADLIARSRRA